LPARSFSRSRVSTVGYRPNVVKHREYPGGGGPNGLWPATRQRLSVRGLPRNGVLHGSRPRQHSLSTMAPRWARASTPPCAITTQRSVCVTCGFARSPNGVRTRVSPLRACPGRLRHLRWRRNRAADLRMQLPVDSGRYPSIFDVMRDEWGISGARRATTSLASAPHQVLGLLRNRLPAQDDSRSGLDTASQGGTGHVPRIRGNASSATGESAARLGDRLRGRATCKRGESIQQAALATREQTSRTASLRARRSPRRA
jgi:hypothetical protein